MEEIDKDESIKNYGKKIINKIYLVKSGWTYANYQEDQSIKNNQMYKTINFFDINKIFILYLKFLYNKILMNSYLNLKAI